MKQKFLSNVRGVAAIEMAIVLPILILIIAAVIEFGIYFLKSQAASRAVSTASISLQQNYSDGTIKTTMQKNGLGMMNLGASPNFVCAKAYLTADAADAGSCTAPDWQTNAPSGVIADTPYYIAVRAFAVHTPLTPLRAISGAFPPDIDSRNIVAVNVTQQTYRTVTAQANVASDGSVAYCNQAGEIVVGGGAWCDGLVSGWGYSAILVSRPVNSGESLNGSAAWGSASYPGWFADCGPGASPKVYAICMKQQ